MHDSAKIIKTNFKCRTNLILKRRYIQWHIQQTILQNSIHNPKNFTKFLASKMLLATRTSNILLVLSNNQLKIGKLLLKIRIRILHVCYKQQLHVYSSELAPLHL